MSVLGSACRAFAAVLLCASVAGCQIRPLAGDYSLGSSTVDIVKHVRCEARAAVAAVTVAYVLKDLDETGLSASIPAPELEKLEDPLQTVSLFERLVKYYEPGVGFNRAVLGTGLLTEDLLETVEDFATTVIGYQFTLTTKETNNVGGNLTFNSVFNPGSFSIMPSGNFNRSRENERVFTIIETIEELVTGRKVPKLTIKRNGNDIDLACNEKTDFRVNWSYPISGKVNLQESFESFSTLVLDEGLGRRETSNRGGSKLDSSAFADTLTFQTVVDGSINPTLALTTPSDYHHLAGASATALNRRTDTHELLLTLQIPTGRDGIDQTELEVKQRLRDERLDRIILGN